MTRKTIDWLVNKTLDCLIVSILAVAVILTLGCILADAWSKHQ